MWCCDNLQGIDAFRSRGLNFSTTSNEAVKYYDSLLRQLISWTDCPQFDGMDGTIKKIMIADPSAILPRAVACGLDVVSTGTSFRINKDLEKKFLEIEKDASICGTEWEKSHVDAIKKWGYGYFQAARSVWESILTDHPTDLLAVKLAHDANFFLGDAVEIRDSLARVLPKWTKDTPCYSYLHGMYAFGLEECGEYNEAEKEAMLALKMEKNDCWATHARAHVMEMNGRYREGINFMEKTADDWVPGTYLAAHNFWHKALYFIELGDYESALTIFDDEVCQRANKSCAMLDIIDASSLLLRLKMEGIEVESRWKQLPDLSSHSSDHILTFNDVHFATLFVGQEDYELEKKMHDSLVNFTRTSDTENGSINRLVGLQLYEGVVDYMNEKYSSAADKLLAIRGKIVHIGGSNAQRDLFSQVLIHSCIESEDKKHWGMTPNLLEERQAIRTGSSPLAERLLHRHQKKHP